MLSQPIDDFPARAGAELEVQPVAETRIDRPVDAVPVLRRVAEVVLARDEVLRRTRARGRRLRVERHRVAAAAREARIARSGERERLVVARSAGEIVGDETIGRARSRPPAPVVADFERDPRHHLVLKVDAPLPVALPHTPAAEQLRVDLREVRALRPKFRSSFDSAPQVSTDPVAGLCAPKFVRVAVDHVVPIVVGPVTVQHLAHGLVRRVVLRVDAVVRGGVEVVAEVELDGRPAVAEDVVGDTDTRGDVVVGAHARCLRVRDGRGIEDGCLRRAVAVGRAVPDARQRRPAVRGPPAGQPRLDPGQPVSA